MWTCEWLYKYVLPAFLSSRVITVGDVQGIQSSGTRKNFVLIKRLCIFKTTWVCLGGGVRCNNLCWIRFWYLCSKLLWVYCGMEFNKFQRLPMTIAAKRLWKVSCFYKMKWFANFYLAKSWLYLSRWQRVYTRKNIIEYKL